MNIKKIRTDKRSIFKYWLRFLKPYHKLRPKEIDALATILYYRYELSRDISNEDMLNTVLFSTPTRNKMREDLGNMGQKIFNNLLTSLRKKKVLSKDNKVMKALIPNMTEDGFKLIFNFEIKDEVITK